MRKMMVVMISFLFVSKKHSDNAGFCRETYMILTQGDSKA